MSSKRAQRGDGRRRILEAALAALEAGDINLLDMSAVARRAGVSRQAVYLHFGNRTALAVAMARYADDKYGLTDAVQPVVDADTPEAMLRAYAAFLGTYNPRIYPVVRMASRIRNDDPDLEAAWLDRLRNRRRAGYSMARRLRGWDRLNPAFSVRAAADWLTAMGSVALWEELVLDLGWSENRFVDFLSGSCCRTLLTDISS